MVNHIPWILPLLLIFSLNFITEEKFVFGFVVDYNQLDKSNSSAVCQTASTVCLKPNQSKLPIVIICHRTGVKVTRNTDCQIADDVSVIYLV